MHHHQQVNAVRVHLHGRSDRVMARLDGRHERGDELIDGRVRGGELAQDVGVRDALVDPVLKVLLALIAVCFVGGRNGVVRNMPI